MKLMIDLYTMYLARSRWFSGMALKLKKTKVSNDHDGLKNYNWRDSDQASWHTEELLQPCSTWLEHCKTTSQNTSYQI